MWITSTTFARSSRHFGFRLVGATMTLAACGAPASSADSRGVLCQPEEDMVLRRRQPKSLDELATVADVLAEVEIVDRYDLPDRRQLMK